MKQTDCCCSEECCGRPAPEQPKKTLVIDFMFIDLTVCDRCLGTDANLDKALTDVAGLLESTGYEVNLNKILVETEDQARELRFFSSPTIRINGRDIQLDARETLCESCGDVCGEDVDCRVWTWQGNEYTTPPPAMIIDAILRNVYGGNRQIDDPLQPFELPDNLKRFFASKARQETSP